MPNMVGWRAGALALAIAAVLPPAGLAQTNVAAGDRVSKSSDVVKRAPASGLPVSSAGSHGWALILTARTVNKLGSPIPYTIELRNVGGSEAPIHVLPFQFDFNVVDLASARPLANRQQPPAILGGPASFFKPGEALYRSGDLSEKVRIPHAGEFSVDVTSSGFSIPGHGSLVPSTRVRLVSNKVYFKVLP